MSKEKNDYKGCTKFDNWLKKSGGYPMMGYFIFTKWFTGDWKFKVEDK